MKIIVTESSFSCDVNVGTEILGLDIDKLIIEHLKKLNLTKRTSKNKMEKRTDRFSPSQSSYDCCRMLYYNMLYPKHSKEDSLGTFAIGDFIHSIIQEIFIEAGVNDLSTIGIDINKAGEKLYYDNTFTIGGECDIKIGDLVIVEVKSVSPWAWKWVAGGTNKGEVVVGKPKIQHIRQLNTYMDIFGVKEGIILYVNKDNLKTYRYTIEHSNMTMLQTIGRCAIAYRAIKDGHIPEKKASEECIYCNHKEDCKRC